MTRRYCNISLLLYQRLHVLRIRVVIGVLVGSIWSVVAMAVMVTSIVRAEVRCGVASFVTGRCVGRGVGGVVFRHLWRSMSVLGSCRWIMQELPSVERRVYVGLWFAVRPRCLLNDTQLITPSKKLALTSCSEFVPKPPFAHEIVTARPEYTCLPLHFVCLLGCLRGR